MRLLKNTKWNGRTYSLEKFTGIHHTSYIKLEEVAEQVQFKLTTKHTRVLYLLEKIHNNYIDPHASLAGVQINMNGIINYFESAVALLLTFYPYYNNHSSKTPHKPQILEINFKGRSHSKNGVDLRCHTKSEYYNLNKYQRKELMNGNILKM